MDGTSWLNDLPEKPCEERNAAILGAVSSGLAICEWSEVKSTYEDHVAIFRVNTDAVYVDVDCGRFRPQCSAALLQKIADIVGGSLPTEKIMDISYSNSKKINCTILPSTSEMSSTTWSKKFNIEVEKKRDGYSGLIRDVGKTWLLDNAIIQSKGAINYGFYNKAAPSKNKIGQRLYQNIGTKHNAFHEDYSQTIILMSIYCILDGEQAKVTDIMKDPKLCGLLAYGGPIKMTRQKI